jgi:hypothetical protein
MIHFVGTTRGVSASPKQDRSHRGTLRHAASTAYRGVAKRKHHRSHRRASRSTLAQEWVVVSREGQSADPAVSKYFRLEARSVKPFPVSLSACPLFLRLNHEVVGVIECRCQSLISFFPLQSVESEWCSIKPGMHLPAEIMAEVNSICASVMTFDEHLYRGGAVRTFEKCGVPQGSVFGPPLGSRAPTPTHTPQRERTSRVHTRCKQHEIAQFNRSDETQQCRRGTSREPVGSGAFSSDTVALKTSSRAADRAIKSKIGQRQEVEDRNGVRRISSPSALIATVAPDITKRRRRRTKTPRNMIRHGRECRSE